MPTADQILETLKSNGPELRRLGVCRLGLFGSAARGEATKTSSSDVHRLKDTSPEDLHARAVALHDLEAKVQRMLSEVRADYTRSSALLDNRRKQFARS